MKTGIKLIAAERIEQMYKHGFDLDHDSQHKFAEIAVQAAALCVMGTDYKVVDQSDNEVDDDWGLQQKLKSDRVHCLKVAGALIAAEIDRVLNNVKK